MNEIKHQLPDPNPGPARGDIFHLPDEDEALGRFYYTMIVRVSPSQYMLAMLDSGANWFGSTYSFDELNEKMRQQGWVRLPEGTTVTLRLK